MNSVDVIRATIWEDGDVTEMARIQINRVNVTQSDIASIQRKIFDLSGDTPDVALKTINPPISGSIFDVLQTDRRWTEDNTGYNFRDRIPAVSFTSGEHTYLVEYLFTASTGEKFWLVYNHPARSVRSAMPAEFAFSLSTAPAEPYIGESEESHVNTPTLDGIVRETSHAAAVTGTQWQITLAVLQHDPNWTEENQADPWVEYSSSNESVATVTSEGLIVYVSDGTCTITGESAATENSPARQETVDITNTSSTDEAETTTSYIADALEPADHVLLVYNGDVANSETLKDYVQSNLPGMDTANVLALAGLPGSDNTTAANITNLILDPIYNWLVANEASKPIRYIVLLRGVPSRDQSRPGGFQGGLSVAYQIYNLLEDRGYRAGNGYKGGESRFSRVQYQGVTSLVSFLDMGSYTATNAYVDKLKTVSDAGGLQGDNVTIDGSDGSAGGTKWYIDERQVLGYPAVLGGQNDQIGIEGIDGGDITYQNNSNGPVILSAADVTYFVNWGRWALGTNWPLDSEIVFTGESGWWLGMSVESYNGIYGSSHGDPVDFFAPTAFGGTAYNNTPVGYAGHTAEPYLSGINTQHYPGRWARGWNAVECAWVSRVTRHFIHVGWPFVER